MDRTTSRTDHDNGIIKIEYGVGHECEAEDSRIILKSASPNSPNPSSSSSSSSSFIQKSIIDDDETRDETCKHYLMNFLNGTTDAKDDCDGMKNAYEAADCEDDATQLNLRLQTTTTTTTTTPRQQPLQFIVSPQEIPLRTQLQQQLQLQSQSQQQQQQTHYTTTATTDTQNGTSNNNNTNNNDDVMIDDYFEAWQCCSSIYNFYTLNCQEPQLDSFKLFGIVAVLVLCGLAKSINRHFTKLKWIPDAAACIFVGATVGGILRIFRKDLIQNNMAFDNDLFLHILLPPIIFQSAITIDKRAFRRDLFPILFLATLGTLFSALTIGYIANFLASLGNSTSLPMVDAMVFGSLISSIDPVATLGILSSVGVGQTSTLYTFIFGESLLNDGVSIVLFDTLVKYVGDGEESRAMDKDMAHEILKEFLKVGFGSIGIGLACGSVCTIYFWALRRRHNAVTETAIFFCFALIPFYISDGASMSGIISIMTMGFFLDFFVIGGSRDDDAQWMAFMQRQMGEDTRAAQLSEWGIFKCCKAFSGEGHMSSRSKHHVGFVAEVIASIMETAIFAYLGLFLFNDKHFWDFRLNTIGILGCIVSRALMVGIFCLIINLFIWLDLENRLSQLCMIDRTRRDGYYDDNSTGSASEREYLDRKTQLIMLLAGVRGAVSFALVENVPVYDAVRKTGSQYKPELKGMTSSSIFFTVFVFGALTYFFVEKDRESGNSGMLAERLLDEPLGSSDDDDENAVSIESVDTSNDPPERNLRI